MTKLFTALFAALVLSGCASVRLDATAVEQPDCPATPTVLKSTLVGLAAGDVTQFLAAPTTPFLSAPPSAEQFRTPRAFVQSAVNGAQAQSTYDMLVRLVPDSEDLLGRQSSSLESAAAARNLHLLITDLAPSVNADVQLRSTLSTANFRAGSTRESIASISTKDDINKRLSSILQAGGDDTLLLYSAAEFSSKLSDFSVGLNGLSSDARAARVAALQAAAANYETSRFIRTYFKAYFRGGKIFQSQLKVDDFTSKAIEAVKSQVKLDPKDEAALESKLKDALSKVCTTNGDSGCLLTSFGKDKLVTRSGESLQFKGISLAVGYDTRVQATWDYPKSVEFAPQLVRVFVEATFDSMKGRPAAVATSTACSTKPPLFATDECAGGATSGKKPSLEDVIAAVDEKASRADSLASVATGQVIRGLSVIALNNEALAKSAENFAGVLARKVVERAAWQQSGAGQCLTSAPAVLIDVVKN